MPYIPKTHEKYDLLPLCRENGGEVFDYPCRLLDKIEDIISPEEKLMPYGYDSYEAYYDEVNHILEKYSDNAEAVKLLKEYLDETKKRNRKEEWSVCKYIGPEYDRVCGLTPGKNYYWPSSFEKPTYRGVLDDEEFTNYLYPTEAEYWLVLEDVTGMAINTIYGDGSRKMSKKEYDSIMNQLKNATIEE